MKTFALVSINGCILSVYKTDTIDSIIHIQNHSQQVIEIRHDVDCCNAFYDNSTKEVKQKPDAPSLHHVFNYTTKQWEDPRTLADLKSAQWVTIKRARSAAEYAGFTWDGSTFDSDAISQNRITGAVTLAQMSSTFSIDWVLADNTVRTLNQSDMLAVGAALGAHVAAIFAKGVLLREQIEAATTAEEVAGVVW
jgi:hypothetical protein